MTDFLIQVTCAAHTPLALSRAWVEGPNEEAAYRLCTHPAHARPRDHRPDRDPADDEELLMPTLNAWLDGLAEMARYAFWLLAGYGIVHLLAHCCQCGA